jgi:hypothetical protein
MADLMSKKSFVGKNISMSAQSPLHLTEGQKACLRLVQHRSGWTQAGAFALWAMHGPAMVLPLPCPPVSKSAPLSCRQKPLGSDGRLWIFIFP